MDELNNIISSLDNEKLTEGISKNDLVKKWNS